MLIPIGKFAAGAATRQLSRWEFRLLEPLVFSDPVHGQLMVPEGFTSDLASVRILREVCRWTGRTVCQYRADVLVLAGAAAMPGVRRRPGAVRPGGRLRHARGHPARLALQPEPADTPTVRCRFLPRAHPGGRHGRLAGADLLTGGAHGRRGALWEGLSQCVVGSRCSGVVLSPCPTTKD